MTEKAGKRIIKEILIFVICGVLAVLIETLVFNRNAIAGKKLNFASVKTQKFRKRSRT